mmetsp:Transcript_2938/g.11903  ORF Transcript_2938/g.11903 Transcript_2938/m.11903 type:complete len:643 (-) Transcript_2938:1606-3534(-)
MIDLRLLLGERRKRAVVVDGSYAVVDHAEAFLKLLSIRIQRKRKHEGLHGRRVGALRLLTVRADGAHQAPMNVDPKIEAHRAALPRRTRHGAVRHRAPRSKVDATARAEKRISAFVREPLVLHQRRHRDPGSGVLVEHAPQHVPQVRRADVVHLAGLVREGELDLAELVAQQQLVAPVPRIAAENPVVQRHSQCPDIGGPLVDLRDRHGRPGARIRGGRGRRGTRVGLRARCRHRRRRRHLKSVELRRGEDRSTIWVHRIRARPGQGVRSTRCRRVGTREARKEPHVLLVLCPVPLRRLRDDIDYLSGEGLHESGRAEVTNLHQQIRMRIRAQAQRWRFRLRPVGGIGIRVSELHEEVLRLDVSVDDAVVVHVKEPQRDVSHALPGLFLTHALVESSPGAMLLHQADRVGKRLLDGLEELRQVRMRLQESTNADFRGDRGHDAPPPGPLSPLDHLHGDQVLLQPQLDSLAGLPAKEAPRTRRHVASGADTMRGRQRHRREVRTPGRHGLHGRHGVSSGIQLLKVVRLDGHAGDVGLASLMPSHVGFVLHGRTPRLPWWARQRNIAILAGERRAQWKQLGGPDGRVRPLAKLVDQLVCSESPRGLALYRRLGLPRARLKARPLTRERSAVRCKGRLVGDRRGS